MDQSIQATIKKVEKIGGELVWVRVVAIGMFAMLGLIVTQLFIMQNSTSTIGTELSEFRVDVLYKFAAIDSRLTDVNGRLTRIEGQLTRIEGQLTKIEGRLTRIETKFSTIQDR